MPKRNSKFYFAREKRIMKMLGLTPTIASGSGWKEKEDGYNDNVIAQLKSTEAESFRITLDDLKKLEYHAMVDHKAPAFFVDFIGPDKLYLVVDVENIEEVYQYMFAKEESTANKLEATSITYELTDDTGLELIEVRKTVGSGDKKQYWDDKQKEYENRRKK